MGRAMVGEATATSTRVVVISPSPPKTGSLNYYFSVQKVPFRRYCVSIKNIRGAEVLKNEVSDDSVHIFRFGSRILPTRVNYKSQTRHSTDPFYDGPVDIRKSVLRNVKRTGISLCVYFRNIHSFHGHAKVPQVGADLQRRHVQYIYSMSTTTVHVRSLAKLHAPLGFVSSSGHMADDHVQPPCSFIRIVLRRSRRLAHASW